MLFLSTRSPRDRQERPSVLFVLCTPSTWVRVALAKTFCGQQEGRRAPEGELHDLYGQAPGLIRVHCVHTTR
jgi:hypothetical protein